MTWLGSLKLKAQLYCGPETAMGPGKADLLEAIDREGSISGAGRAMGMSYRRTWLLVDAMNRCWTEPLVSATAGGGRGSGARLTDAGRAVLDAYRHLEAALAAAAEGEALRTLQARLRPAPMDHQPPRPGD
ncbi:winged helix-turn-helix domain-containing protein [Caulobacter sp. KR2-114]|uniref:winged helix-turn-helix domain-containing protein n=1 Tax=Caulobacter sp. KR2-114 TaxID=3400912 RepID=UPI003BFF1D8C